MELTEVGAMLADTAERLFTAHAEDIDRAAHEGVWPAAAWAAIEESGLPLALVPEAQGGFGVPPREALALIRQSGRYALALPLAETMMGNAALAAAGLSLAEGPVGLADSKNARVPWGRHAGTIVLGDDTGVQRHVGLKVSAEGTNMAGHPRDQMTVPARQVGSAGTAPVLGLGALARALQMAGALERVLEMTVEHVSSRVQFGRPLAKFQAIQQELSRMAGEAAASGVIAEAPFAALDAGQNPEWQIAAAKARTSEAAGVGATVGHQTHGAIGFTYEHSLHFATRRLWSWRSEFGGARFWSRRLGERAVGRGVENFWADIVAG